LAILGFYIPSVCPGRKNICNVHAHKIPATFNFTKNCLIFDVDATTAV